MASKSSAPIDSGLSKEQKTLLDNCIHDSTKNTTDRIECVVVIQKQLLNIPESTRTNRYLDEVILLLFTNELADRCERTHLVGSEERGLATAQEQLDCAHAYRSEIKQIDGLNTVLLDRFMEQYEKFLYIPPSSSSTQPSTVTITQSEEERKEMADEFLAELNSNISIFDGEKFSTALTSPPDRLEELFENEQSTAPDNDPAAYQ